MEAEKSTTSPVMKKVKRKAIVLVGEGRGECYNKGVKNTEEWYCFCVRMALTNVAYNVECEAVDHLSESKTVKAREDTSCCQNCVNSK